MKNTTAIIISFLRPQYTLECIKSLKKEAPDIKILVGENGNFNKDIDKLCKEVGAEYIQLPYDSGVCVARNELIKRVNTKYVLVGDDDFYYTSEAKISEMEAFLDGNDSFDLIGGRVKQYGIVKNYQGFIQKNKDHFKSFPINVDEVEYSIDDNSRLRFTSADLVFNFFVARTDKIKKVPWDEEIKVAYEHFSWFYDFKLAGGKVAFSPDPVVIHKPEHVVFDMHDNNNEAYMAFRNRKSDKDRFFGKYGLKYTIGMNGTVTYANGDSMGENKNKNETKFVDFCITTFKRPEALKRLLYSIAEYYPMANVYVADQNETFDREFYRNLRTELQNKGLIKRVSFEKIPYDSGLSYARNHLVLTTPNKYKLILDDDFVFNENTDIGKMVKLIEAHPKAGVVGGLVKQLGTELHFEFNIEKEGKKLLQKSDGNNWKTENGLKFKKTGCVLNFALMRKELFSYIQWDPLLKVSEHMDFYTRMKQVPMYVLYLPEVWIDHPPTDRSADYKEFRQRDQFQKAMFKKHGVTKLQYLNGQVIELLENGSFSKYKIKV